MNEGLCRYAVVPLESSAVCDLMMRCNFRIVRSVRLRSGRCPTSAVGEGSSKSAQGGNSTRFLCISKQLEIYPGADRTSLMMTLPREPGALADVLSCLSVLGISLGRLESRAACTFYFELEAPVSSPQFCSAWGNWAKSAKAAPILAATVRWSECCAADFSAGSWVTATPLPFITSSATMRTGSTKNA